MLSLGRREGKERVAHLLCEIATRCEAADLSFEEIGEFPLTQEQMGDALGLTAVHINRVLKELERQEYIHREKREIFVPDWPRLRRFADFSERYLHLEERTLR